jgi:hypothetical protein
LDGKFIPGMAYVIIVSFSDGAANRVSSQMETSINASKIVFPAINYPDLVEAILGGTVLVGKAPFSGVKVAATCSGVEFPP